MSMRLKKIRLLTAVMLLLVCLLEACFATAEKTVLLTFTGDVTLGGKDDERGYDDCFDAVAADKGYDYFFANYRGLFEQDDLTVINFEGVLSDSKTQESRIKRYRFRGPTENTKNKARR